MIRALLALLAIAAAVAVAVFFADHPGHIEIEWLGRASDTSVGVLVAAITLVALMVALAALVVAALSRAPRNLRRRRAARRQRLGEAALTRGLVALAADDAGEARRHAARAAALSGGSPTALLLTAAAAQRQGDSAAAQQAYTALLEQPDSEFLGLRGLIGQAMRAGEDDAARRLAERARLLRPRARWLADSLLVLQARAGDWAAARDTLAGATRRGALPADAARHHRGVILHELSAAAERRGALREAAGLAAKAQALAPDLAPLAVHHARLLAGLGRARAAAKAIERAWRAAPHPELARAFAELRPDDEKLERAAALQRLAARNPDAPESRLAIAEAALDAQLWGEARRHLELAAATASAESAESRPSRRLCLLMARLEENEPGDLTAARQWLDRAIGAPADPCYVCRNCGAEAERWQALCGHCGDFDTLAWRAPERGVQPIGAASPEIIGGAAPLMLPVADVPGGNRLAGSARSDN